MKYSSISFESYYFNSTFIIFDIELVLNVDVIGDDVSFCIFCLKPPNLRKRWKIFASYLWGQDWKCWTYIGFSLLINLDIWENLRDNIEVLSNKTWHSLLYIFYLIALKLQHSSPSISMPKTKRTQLLEFFLDPVSFLNEQPLFKVKFCYRTILPIFAKETTFETSCELPSATHVTGVQT